MNNKTKDRLYFWFIQMLGDIGSVLMMIGFALRYDSIFCFLVFITIGFIWSVFTTKLGEKKGL